MSDRADDRHNAAWMRRRKRGILVLCTLAVVVIAIAADGFRESRGGVISHGADSASFDSALARHPSTPASEETAATDPDSSMYRVVREIARLTVRMMKDQIGTAINELRAAFQAYGPFLSLRPVFGVDDVFDPNLPGTWVAETEDDTTTLLIEKAGPRANYYRWTSDEDAPHEMHLTRISGSIYLDLKLPEDDFIGHTSHWVMRVYQTTPTLRLGMASNNSMRSFLTMLPFPHTDKDSMLVLGGSTAALRRHVAHFSRMPGAFADEVVEFRRVEE